MGNRIKQYGALFVSLFLMLGAVAFAANSAGHTLETYPKPFIEEGELSNTLIVVGRDAATSDVIGAIEIGANLQAMATTKAEIEFKTDEPVVTGGVSEKVTFGEEVNDEIGEDLEDNDVEGLKDGKVSFDGENYDYREIVMVGNDLKVVTSLTENDEDYEDNVYMEIREGAIKYRFVFDDNIDLGDVDEDEELKIEFLGNHLEIVDVDSDSITVQLGKETFLKQGETWEFTEGDETYEVTLDAVSSDSDKAYIGVNGIYDVIEEGEEETIEGLEVLVKNAFSDEDGDAVILIVGTTTRETFDDGDPFIGEDDDDPEWVWELSDLLSNDKDLITLGVSYDLTLDSADDEPVEVGGCYTLPSDYLKICLDSLTEDSYSEYSLEYDSSYSDIDDVYNGKSDEHVFVFESKEQDGFKMANTGEETDEVVIWVKDSTGTDVEVFYRDEDDNDLKSDDIYSEGSGTVTIATIEYEDTSLDVELVLPTDLTSDYVTLKVASPVSNDDLWMPLKVDFVDTFVGLGPTEEDSDPEDLVWDSKNLGTREENALTLYGIRLLSPDSNTDNDRVKFEVPADHVEANILVSGVETEIEPVVGEAGVYVNQFESPISKLDTEIGDYRDYNVIVVGGPCANDVAAGILGSGTDPATCATGFTDGKAMIRYIEDTGKGNSALIVAGYSALDTRNAAHALVNKQVLFRGTEVTVTSNGPLYSYTTSNMQMMEPESTESTEGETA